MKRTAAELRLDLRILRKQREADKRRAATWMEQCAARDATIASLRAEAAEIRKQSEWWREHVMKWQEWADATLRSRGLQYENGWRGDDNARKTIADALATPAASAPGGGERTFKVGDPVWWQHKPDECVAAVVYGVRHDRVTCVQVADDTWVFEGFVRPRDPSDTRDSVTVDDLGPAEGKTR